MKHLHWLLLMVSGCLELCDASAAQGVGQPPRIILTKTNSPAAQVFLFGNPVTTPQLIGTGPGTFSQSGVLQPGQYVLDLYGNGIGSGSACGGMIGEASATFNCQLDFGNSGVQLTIAPAYAVAVAAQSHMAVAQQVQVFGNQLLSVSDSAVIHCSTPPDGVSFGTSMLSVHLQGAPSAQTQWQASGFARSRNVSNGQTFTAVETFTVSVATNYSVTVSTSFEHASGSIPSAGSSQFVPVLPSGSNGSAWIFLALLPALWWDPPLAYGYDFAATGTARFSQIVDFPANIDGDGSFVVRTGDQTVGTFHVGQGVDFVSLTGAPVTSFQVFGIDPLLNGTGPASFPIQLNFDTLPANFTMSPINMVPPLPYCFGDGSTIPCPCGNAGSTGNGCASSFNSAGANLAFDGVTSVVEDSLELNATGTSDSSVLYFQGTTQIAAAFGDGLRCVGGMVLRLGHAIAMSGVSHYPGPGDPAITVKGAVPSGGGVTRNYQCWYRNAATFCTSSTFNLTNGLSVTWTP